MDKDLLNVLYAREERWEMRKSLAEKCKGTIITITLCIPLAYRIGEELWPVFLKLCKAFYKILLSKDNSVHYEGCIRSYDGPAFFISTGAEAEEIKKICVYAEETIPGGRMLDIDVMDSDKKQIGRSDIGLPPRKCFICDSPAYLCVSRRLHSSEQVAVCVDKLKKEAEKLTETIDLDKL
ncbi:MAG: citrate lyase holo-[acyl-carrier protein] synthase [Bacillota bacterium]|nr:citrate lyase holo-[acyl-carrier protein] synthase [Bacillota bacterium]